MSQGASDYGRPQCRVMKRKAEPRISWRLSESGGAGKIWDKSVHDPRQIPTFGWTSGGGGMDSDFRIVASGGAGSSPGKSWANIGFPKKGRSN